LALNSLSENPRLISVADYKPHQVCPTAEPAADFDRDDDCKNAAVGGSHCPCICGSMELRVEGAEKAEQWPDGSLFDDHGHTEFTVATIKQKGERGKLSVAVEVTLRHANSREFTTPTLFRQYSRSRPLAPNAFVGEQQ
jgi:hypothetical protein